MKRVKNFFRKLGRGWIKFGKILGTINQRIIMTILYLTAVAVTAIMMRLLGKDPLAIKGEKSSYWIDAEKYEQTTERYRKLG